MTIHYTDFYKDLYRMSNGYIPLWPFATETNLGDLFVLRSGQMIKIGNIGDKFFGVYDEISIEQEWQPFQQSWDIQSGIQESYKSKKQVNIFCNPCETSGLKIKFDFPGAYFFHAPKVFHRSIENFYEFKFKLLQYLTSEKFSFKEIFVVTSIAKAQNYTLLISSGSNAQMVIDATEESTEAPQSLFGLIGNKIKTEVTQLDNIHTAHINKEGGQFFFRAQKLKASHQGKEIVRKYLIESLPESVKKNAENILEFVPTQILPSVNIFPAKVHELFDFRRMNLDDISMFFGEDIKGRNLNK
ncbi:MAG: hypothetical protein AB8H03_11095 [Saprospiraceae bacterium]